MQDLAREVLGQIRGHLLWREWYTQARGPIKDVAGKSVLRKPQQSNTQPEIWIVSEPDSRLCRHSSRDTQGQEGPLGTIRRFVLIPQGPPLSTNYEK